MRRMDFLPFHRLVSTCLGIGYIRKGGGTVAAAVCCIAWYFAWEGGNRPFWAPIAVTLALLALGIWSAGKVEAGWGEDSYRVVIDEVAGMCITLLFIPVKWPYVLIGLVLFRFFDIHLLFLHIRIRFIQRYFNVIIA